MHKIQAICKITQQEALKMKFEGTLENFIYNQLARGFIEELINLKCIQLDQQILAPSPQDLYKGQIIVFKSTILVEQPNNLKV